MSNHQHHLNLDAAITAGLSGMTAAALSAGPAFAELADDFIRRFASQAIGSFSSEELVRAAAAEGIEPQEARAWGAAFQKAARAGVIVRSSEAYRRTRGHGSLGLKWRRA